MMIPHLNEKPMNKMSGHKSFFLMAFIMAVSAADLTYEVTEEIVSPGSFVGNVQTDAQLASYYLPSEMTQLGFSFFTTGDSNDFGLFTIEESTGIIRTSEQIDREFICGQQPECILKLSVAVTPTEFLRIIEVNIRVLDFNDHLPSDLSRHLVQKENLLIKFNYK